MNTRDYCAQIAQELDRTLRMVNPDESAELIDMIDQAKRIFVTGAGRSLLMMKAFAMRLMHLGFSVFVVGEIVTPAIQASDLLLIGSGSGENGSMALHARKAIAQGARVALVSASRNSTLGQLANLVMLIPISTEKTGNTVGNKSIQPGGSTFEQSLLLVLDAVVLVLLDKMPPGTSVMNLHANLE